jgi:hypothetical protein
MGKIRVFLPAKLGISMINKKLKVKNDAAECVRNDYFCSTDNDLIPI